MAETEVEGKARTVLHWTEKSFKSKNYDGFHEDKKKGKVRDDNLQKFQSQGFSMQVIAKNMERE